MKLTFGMDELLEFILKRRLAILLCAFAGLLIFVSVSSYLYYAQKRKALLSAEIALGIQNLESGKTDLALKHFEPVFNSRKDLYGLISGAGIIKTFTGDQKYTTKAHDVLFQLKNYQSPEFIRMFILSSYMQTITKDVEEKETDKYLKILERFSEKSENSFSSQIQNIKQ